MEQLVNCIRTYYLTEISVGIKSSAFQRFILGGLILFVISGIPGRAQDMKFTFQTIQEGLSHHFVKCILKDSQGFMWFGTNDGLNKFDGTGFVIYENDSKDTTSLSHNTINAILEDSDNNIWVGTSNGLNLYNREKDNFTTLKIFGRRDILCVNALHIDKEGLLWIGTLGAGVFVYDRENSKLVSFLNIENDSTSLSSDFIHSISSDDENNVWLGTRNGLCLFNKNNNSFRNFRHTTAEESLNSNYITDLVFDRSRDLWIGTYGGGLNKLTRKGDRFNFKKIPITNHKENLNQKNILSLCFDHRENLWIGTENGGMSCLSKNMDIVHFSSDENNPKRLASNSIWSIYEDNNGIMWIGTYNKGVNILDENYEKFTHIKKNINAEKSLVNNSVKGFSEDEEGYLWISTDGGGISCMETKTKKFVNKIDNSNVSSQASITVLCDSRQNIWIGTWAGGIDRFDIQGNKIKNYKNGIAPGPANNIISLCEDKQHRIWAGSAGSGLFFYDEDKDSFIQFLDTEQRTHLSETSIIISIMEDHNNTIWVSTLFGLIYMKRNEDGSYSLNEYLHNSSPGSISSFRINHVFEDRKNNLWVGTEDGLNLFNRQDSTFTVFEKQDGLPNNSINGILEDNKGNLWLSTNEGISKFNPEAGTFKNFTKEDGLNSNEFNLNSCIKTRSGEFFFGGNNGFNAFYPDSIRTNEICPPVYLTNFMLFNTPVKIDKEGSPLKKNISMTSKMDLTWDQNSFSIEYVALNYTRSARNQYAFKLEGFEDNWNYVGSRRRATYTNLDPGTYIFKVKGSNNDGLWNETPAQVEIVIASPYWQTIWAYLLYFFIVSTLLYSFIKLLIIRARQAENLKIEKVHREKDEELNKMKINFFTNISHELRTPLSLIISPMEQMIQEGKVKGALLGQLKMIFRNVERLYHLVNELLDFTKSEEKRLEMRVQKADIRSFVHEVFFLFGDKAVGRRINYQFEAEEEEIEAWFDKNKLEKILMNLISNAFKHAPDDGEIIVHVGKIKMEHISGIKNLLPDTQQEEYIEIMVSDNGPGIEPEYLDKIFERYYQSPEEEGKPFAGTGIGLALVKNLVELHHGRITVSSAKWEKTCFNILLPLGKDHFNENDFIASTDKNVSPATRIEVDSSQEDHLAKTDKDLPLILIVEDNDELREYLVSVIAENYRVLEASNGESGYQLASEHIPDLIISDIIMPKVTGTELCKLIKENMSTSHIPLILLTAKADNDDKIEGIETGADAYITKPFNVKFVESTIRNLIVTRRLLFRRFSQEVYILPKKISNNALDQKFLTKIIEYINENVSDGEITVENLASYLSMNRSNVYRKIKALTGQTATEFIRTVRLKMAIKYLESGEHNISEIAYKVGFESPGYFAKCFKSQFGKSPSEFLTNKTSEMTISGS